MADSSADKVDCSPDGTSRLQHATPGSPKSANVYTVGVDGTRLRQVTHATGGTIDNGLDSWSPDGKKIAFASNKTGTYEIYSMNADGTGPSRSREAPKPTPRAGVHIHDAPLRPGPIAMTIARGGGVRGDDL